MENETLIKEAESGNAEAMFRLGLWYLKRAGGYDDYWNKHADVKTILAPLDGLMVPDEEEYGKGTAWLEKATLSGYDKAYIALAYVFKGMSVMSDKGYRVMKRDEEKYVEMFAKAFDAGYKDAAAVELGWYYRSHDDKEKAVEWYAKGGMYYEAAILCEDGSKYDLAFQYYCLAFEKGLSEDDLMHFLERYDPVYSGSLKGGMSYDEAKMLLADGISKELVVRMAEGYLDEWQVKVYESYADSVVSRLNAMKSKMREAKEIVEKINNG